MELFRYKEPVNFMKYSRKFGILSLVLVLLSWGLIFTKGFNYGIDFAGGTLIQLKYDKKAPIKQIREALSKSKAFEGANVTFFGSDKEVVIRTKSIIIKSRYYLIAYIKKASIYDNISSYLFDT